MGANIHQIDFPLEKCFQINQQTKVAIGSINLSGRKKCDEKIKVTGRRHEIAPSGGAEQFQKLHLILSAQLGNLRLVLIDVA